MNKAEVFGITNPNPAEVEVVDEVVNLSFSLVGEEVCLSIDRVLEFSDDHTFTIGEDTEAFVGLDDDGDVIVIFHNLSEELAASILMDLDQDEPTYQTSGLYRVRSTLQ